MKISWLKKIADFEDSKSVQMEFRNPERNETGIVNGTAMETALRSMRFGEVYRIILKDKVSNETVGPFDIEACKFFNEILTDFYQYCMFGTILLFQTDQSMLCKFYNSLERFDLDNDIMN